MTRKLEPPSPPTPADLNTGGGLGERSKDQDLTKYYFYFSTPVFNLKKKDRIASRKSGDKK